MSPPKGALDDLLAESAKTCRGCNELAGGTLKGLVIDLKVMHMLNLACSNRTTNREALRTLASTIPA